MKLIINKNQYNKLLVESKISALQKLVDSQITDKYDFVCKVVIAPPHHYNPQYSATIYFKEIDNSKMTLPKYLKMKEEVMDEVWELIYGFTNETVSLYRKIC